MSSQSFLQPLATLDAASLWPLAVGLPVVALVLVVLSRRRSSLPTPPGPPPKPLLGNMLDMPPADGSPWLKYSEWAKTYGQ